jgi:hypothetical protein
VSLLEDKSHIVLLDGIREAARGEWHQTSKKAPSADSTYWIDLSFGEKRSTRLEYDNPTERDAMWEQIRTAMMVMYSLA